MRERMDPRFPFRLTALVVALLLGLKLTSEGQNPEEKAPPVVARAAVPISFLPPPLEGATFSLGIYEAKSGKLIRHLHEVAAESAFTVGVNGLITKWDGKNDKGEVVAPGRYAARGYAVGALKVTGVDILGNDWTAEDENLRIKHVEAIGLLPSDSGLAVLATMADGNPALLRFKSDGKLLWRVAVKGLSPDGQPRLEVRDNVIFVMPERSLPPGSEVASVAAFRGDDGGLDGDVQLSRKSIPAKFLGVDGVIVQAVTPAPDLSTTVPDPNLTIRSGVGTSPSSEKPSPASMHSAGQRSPGKDGTFWAADGLNGLVQTSRDGVVLRHLDVVPADPLAIAVSASPKEDRLYLLEEKDGWQRVRGLSWVETSQEDGKQVSTWQTFFERNIRKPDPALALESAGAPVEISLMDNPLTPGVPQKVKLAASFDEKGSYLTTADGLRLRQISERPALKAVRLTKGKTANSLLFYQTDGAAWDEFSIEDAKNMMAFDAGEFEMTATGEKPNTEKAPEPPDL
jgi:hypothetical protein